MYRQTSARLLGFEGSRWLCLFQNSWCGGSNPDVQHIQRGHEGVQTLDQARTSRWCIDWVHSRGVYTPHCSLCWGRGPSITLFLHRCAAAPGCKVVSFLSQWHQPLVVVVVAVVVVVVVLVVLVLVLKMISVFYS